MGGVSILTRLPPALQRKNYAALWVVVVVTGLGGQMAAVAIGWQVYSIHRDPLDLGLIGLMEFIPLPLLALPAGTLADRVSRRLILTVALVMDIAVMSALIVVSLSGARELWPFLALAFATGVGGAIGSPPARALSATLVPAELIASAMALRSLAFQMAVVVGPAIGGFLFAIRPEAAYGTAALMSAIGIGCLLVVNEPPVERDPSAEQLGLRTVLGGIHFIRGSPMLLGAISLDLFAVLFGGAVALLPLFARSILHTGPIGLGFLRSAPAAGAIAAGLWMTRRPLKRHVGHRLLIVVAAFGASMVVFGLSHSFALSMVALAVSGFADMISMNIRGTAVALGTPDSVRGRVMAVEMVFISASNELGAFESGVAAKLLGAVTAVVAGGAVTIGLAAGWLRFFPALAGINRFEDVKAEPQAASP
jgi:MFS family permease